MLLPVKLAGAIAGAAIVAAGALGVSVHVVTEHARVDQARSLLDSRLRAAAQAYADSGVVTFGSELDDQQAPAPLRETAMRGRRATYLQEPGTDGPQMWAATTVDGRLVSVRSSFAADRAAIDQLDRTLLIAGLAIAALSTLLGALVALGLSRRLRAAARIAGQVAAGDLDARVSQSVGGRDEVTALGAAVDRMADALTARIATERQVTADIAHELRTPVTGLITAAELLPPSRPTELVRDRARVLKTLVEEILEVARLDTDVEVADIEVVALAEFTKRCVARTTVSTQAVQVVADASVGTDPRRVERIVANLVANAAKHGAQPIVITVDGPVITVRDNGPGFPGGLIAQGPQRFHTRSRDRSSGHGLGLTIAMGQAKVLGVTLTLANPPGGGAMATLDLSSGLLRRL